MLLCTRTHFIRSLEAALEGQEGGGSEEERRASGTAMMDRMTLYATDESGKAPGADVYFWSASGQAKTESTEEEKGSFNHLIKGKGPKPGQRVVYVDGGFDLFSSGHIAFLRKVVEEEEELARKDGWFSEQAVNERRGKGADYPPAFVVVGVHEDEVINRWKGVNYPIMNIFERGLCVLQCKVRLYVESIHPPKPLLRVLTPAPVHQRRHLRRALYPDQGVSDIPPPGHPGRGVPRPHVLYAADVRPVHGAPRDGHLPGDWRARLLGGQRWADCAADHAQPRSIRGETAGEGDEERSGGCGERTGGVGGGAAEERTGEGIDVM